MTRTNIAVESEVADSLSDEASKENKTLYALANEALRTVLKVRQEGGSIEDIYTAWLYARISGDLDVVPIPANLLEKMVKTLYLEEKESILKAWYDEGSRIGTYLRVSFPKINELAPEVAQLSRARLLPVKRVEIRQKEGEAGRTVVRVVGAGLSEESTRCAEQFVRGLISAYSLKIVESSVSEDIIEMRVAG